MIYHHSLATKAFAGNDSKYREWHRIRAWSWEQYRSSPKPISSFESQNVDTGNKKRITCPALWWEPNPCNLYRWADGSRLQNQEHAVCVNKYQSEFWSARDSCTPLFLANAHFTSLISHRISCLSLVHFTGFPSTLPAATLTTQDRIIITRLALRTWYCISIKDMWVTSFIQIPYWMH